jgi:hypothetical protein
MNLLERYSLGRRLHIREWEQHCLATLIARPEGLTVDEGNQLGMKAVIFISTLREARTRPQTSQCANCGIKTSIETQNVDAGAVEQQIMEWLDSGD